LTNCNIEDFAKVGLLFIYAGGFSLNNTHFFAPDAGTFEYYIEAHNISIPSFIGASNTIQSKGATLAYASGFKSWVNTPTIVSMGFFADYTSDGTTLFTMPIIRSGVYDSYLQNAIEIDYLNIKGMSYYYLGTKKHTYGTAAPGSGTWELGDIVYNTEPAATEWVGWICVSAGTPGTWKGFGVIQS
jgi:hypothetical protein